MIKPRIPIALEGYPFIGFMALTAMVFAMLDYDVLSLAALFTAAFVLFFFRDPERIIPDEGDVVVSPADGRIILVEKVFDDRFLDEEVCKVSIFMNVFNVHVNRVPFPGRVEKVRYSAGRFFAANTDRGALENEYCAVISKTDNGSRYAMVQVAGLVARRIVCWATAGDQLARGDRFGLIRFGSRVDLYLPLDVRLEVSPGQKVKAGDSILGYL